MQRRRNRGAGVGDLVLAHQRRQRQVEQPLLALENEAAALLEGLVVLAPDGQRRAEPPRDIGDDLERLRRLHGDDSRHAAA